MCWLSTFFKTYVVPHCIQYLLLLQKALEVGPKNLAECYRLCRHTCLIAFICKYRNFLSIIGLNFNPITRWGVTLYALEKCLVSIFSHNSCQMTTLQNRKRRFLWYSYLFSKKLCMQIITYTSAISHKCESENGGNKKTKHTKSSEKRTFLIPWYAYHTHVCVSMGRKCSFVGKFGVFCFLVTSFLRFAPLPYHRRIKYSVYLSSCSISLGLKWKVARNLCVS